MELLLGFILGLITFSLTKYIEDFLIKPILRHNDVIYRIDNKLKFYANVITSEHILQSEQRNKYEEAYLTFRDLSCELEATYKSIPFKNTPLLKLFHLKSLGSISEASRSLIYISNNIGIRHPDDPDSRNYNVSQKIREKLSIPEI